MSRVFIWSNGNPYSSEKEYGEAIEKSRIGGDEGDINVFINKFLPLRLCKGRFENTHNLSIHRIHESNNKFGFGFWGNAELETSEALFKRSFLLSSDGHSCYELSKDRICNKDYNLDLENPNWTLQDEDCFKGYPEDKIYKQTTGFLAFFLMKRMFPDKEIVLVNFGVRDQVFKNTATIHGIEFEDRYFNEKGIKREFI